ncbi:MAG: hypothetical protein AB8G23_15795 [Myxococcota bacterium]
MKTVSKTIVASFSRALSGALASWVALAFLMALPHTALAEEFEPLTEITWAHPAPERVSRFVVMISPTNQASASTRWVEVGKPAGASSGSMRFYTALIPVASDSFVSIGAVGINGLMSSMSSFTAVPPPRPGQPLVVDN